MFDTRGGLNDPKQSIEAYGLAMNIKVDLTDALAFRSISAWRKDDTATPIDFDALPAVDLDVPAIYKDHQFSQELQLVADRGPLQGVAGFYYLNANASDIFDVRLYTLAADGSLLWTEQQEGRAIEHDGEPGTTAWQRFMVWLLSLLPIDGLL